MRAAFLDMANVLISIAAHFGPGNGKSKISNPFQLADPKLQAAKPQELSV